MSVSPERESVRHALKELQLKTRLLEEERDYYKNLEVTSAHAFEEHRAELSLLIGKEREYMARREESLQARLEALLTENRRLQGDVEQLHAEQKNRISGAMEQLQRDSAQRELRARQEIDMCQTELRKVRTHNSDCEADITNVRRAIHEMAERHAALNKESREAAEYNNILVDARAAAEGRARAQRNARREAHARKVSPHQYATGRHKPYFLPAGKVDRENMTVPTSQNAQAFVSAVQKSNYRAPRHVDPKHSFAPEYEVLCASVVGELEELRREYDIISRHIGTDVPSENAANRLRAIYAAMDRKHLQLLQLRDSQTRQEDYERLREILNEVEQDNRYCKNRMQELLSVLRTDS